MCTISAYTNLYICIYSSYVISQNDKDVSTRSQAQRITKLMYEDNK